LFFFQAEDGIRAFHVTGVQTCALPIKRGWRLTAPNLEQVGLLEIRYRYLDEACAEESLWSGSHPALAGAPPSQRRAVARTLLDQLRRNLAIRTHFLEKGYLDQLRNRSQH